MTKSRIAEDITPRQHAIFWVSALMIVGFSIWASVSTLDIVSVAEGEVIPSSQVKTVQHLEGGIVRDIKVTEGQEVKAQQPLVVLEPTVSSADVAELRVRLRSLETDIAQFEALATGAEQPAYSAELTNNFPNLVEQATRRFETRRDRHRDEVIKQEQAILQSQQGIIEIEKRIAGGKESLALVAQQVEMSDELLRQNLANRFRHLDLLKEARQLRNAIDADKAALERARTSLNQARAELASIKSTFADQVQQALEEARLRSRELNQRIIKFEDSLNRTVVRSPVDGIVKTLSIATVGGVVRSGDTIAEIVPVDDTLIIEAKLPTQDIGYVAVGQPATVRLTSSDAIRFGNLTGNVVDVSPDTLVTPEGVPFYRVRVELESNVFKNGALKYELFPGMQVVTSIQTGERTVLAYILDPLRTSMSDAFQER